MHFLEPEFLIHTLGLLGIFAVIFAETGFVVAFFLPGDTLLLAAGIFAAQGFFPLSLVFGTIFLAATLGYFVGYFIGKRAGRSLFNREDSIFFKKEYVARSQSFYEKHGAKTIFVARFIPIIRTFAPIVAGIGQMKFFRFAIFNIAGGLLWALFMPTVGYFFGSKIPNVDAYIGPVILTIIILSFVPIVWPILRAKFRKSSSPTE